MAEKRYYWLKLKNTYFNQLLQKKMRRQENGKEMQIVYLRMLLLSLDKGGNVFYQGVYDSLEDELAEEFDESPEIIRKTVKFLLDNNMISIDDENNCYMPEAVECTGSECYSAERVRHHRARKTLQCNSDVTGCNEEKEKEKEIEIEKERREEKERINYQQIADMYNEICVSFPRCTKLSDERKKAIKARLKNYSTDDFRKLFRMAEESSFLKGGNGRNWSASFDWLIKDSNMAKVLDGNYVDSDKRLNPEEKEYRKASAESAARIEKILLSSEPRPDDPFQ